MENSIIQLISIITPYVILLTTIFVNYFNKRKIEIPNLQCSFEKYPACNVKASILCITNISDYTAFDFKITPSLEIWSTNYVYVKQNTIIKNETVKYILPENDGKLQEITMEYKDKFNKRHIIKHKINSKENGDVSSKYDIEINTIIIK